jgi:hypothetical protein
MRDGFTKVGLTVWSGMTLFEVQKKLCIFPSVDLPEDRSLENLVGRESKYIRHELRGDSLCFLNGVL